MQRGFFSSSDPGWDYRFFCCEETIGFCWGVSGNEIVIPFCFVRDVIGGLRQKHFIRIKFPSSEEYFRSPTQCL